MDLWIRSQDKADLRKVKKDIIIEQSQCLCLPKEEIYEIEEFQILVDGYCLGIYKTSERAVKVLDDIQDFMKNSIENKYATKETVDNDFSAIKYFKEITTPDWLVFELPKE